jgi:two-component system alkaline phosphatase synthesis response regulator PhoP
MARIAIIDDDQDLRRFVKRHLTRLGHSVLCASDGFQGIELVEEHRPELIILDVMMPTLDGVEICKRFKAHAEIAQIPVIFLTAKSGACSRVRGIESGGDAYMTKPFEVAELESLINAVLARAQQRSG